ncbi:MAG: FxSxx-COOH system tetratricopeptide repeat protein [Chloroflexota bacterium]|nr:FxSxx-COOH system tetratricopeptide repeat protein [Chloroflexota bacterium]
MDAIDFVSFGEVLKALRKKRKINQQELSGRLGVHPNTISKWERGICLPDSKGIVLEVAKLLRLREQETRLLLDASLTALSPYWQVPYQRNPFFTGRIALLQALHEQLCGQQTIALSQSYALSGLGGIGKTQLALEYAYQHALDYRAVFWIAAETLETIDASFIAVAEQLRLPEREDKDHHQIVKAVLRWLTMHKEWLLIFDNLEAVSLIKPCLPPARQGAILITTRLHALEGLAQTLELPSLSLEEGVSFLLRRARLCDPAARRDPLPPNLEASTYALVEAMAGLPLALDQAGGYIERTGCSLSDYLHMYQQHSMQLLREHSEVTDHPHSVVKTFQLTFERLQQTNAAAIDLLRLCAFLHPDAIPEELIRDGAQHASLPLQRATTDAFLLDRALAELLKFSLLRRITENKTLSLHRLLQAVLLDTMTEPERDYWLQQAIVALDTVFPQVEYATWKQCERLLPHALLCLNRAAASQESLTLASLAYKVAQYLRAHGRYAEAEPLFQQALRIREQQLGPEHLDVTYPLAKLAELYRLQGKYAEAEPLFQQVLRIREQQLGPEHLDVVYPLNGLGTLYAEQGKYVEAEPFLLQALRIREQQLGPEHPLVASPLTNLAIIYKGQGKYVEAEPLLQRTLRIREQQLGPEHPDVAYSLNNLATLYHEQGRYAETEPLFQRALRIREQQLGPEHPDVAYPLSNLATLYADQGKYAEAELLFQRALHIREQLGAEHPLVAYPLNGLAEIYRLRGNYAEAEAFSQRTLRIWEQQLGPDHPLVAYPLNNLAEIYQAQGNYTEAEPLFQRALSIREHDLEPHLADLADTLHGLATLREAQGNILEAASLYRRALTIREQFYDQQQHPKISDTRERLRAVLQALGKLEGAATFEETQQDSAKFTPEG